MDLGLGHGLGLVNCPMVQWSAHHLKVLEDSFCEISHILISDSSLEMRLGKLVSNLSHHELKEAFSL